MKKIFRTVVASLLLLSAANASAQVSDPRELLQSAKMSAAESVDIDTFVQHFKAHPSRWEKVFEIIEKSDLSALPLGLTQVDENIKMNVQEYTTRPTVGKRLLYEKHNDYIDVQCVVRGEELHGKSNVENAQVVREYNAEKDIAMYDCEDVPFYIIGAGEFTIFFPHEVHTTNYGFGEQTQVRKVVFKVKYN